MLLGHGIQPISGYNLMLKVLEQQEQVTRCALD